VATIAIISQKGGAGKTTVAVHLAAAAELAGHTALVFDTDQQATASQWAAWRKGTAPEVVESSPNMLASKVDAARRHGAGFIVIDTPPHADSAASAAMQVADLVLIPCRPSAFDLAAIQTTARLVQMFRKPAYVVFTAGSPTAPKLYLESAEAAHAFGLETAPVHIPDRATFRHATAEGRTAMELEPRGKAADEIRQLFEWVCGVVHFPTSAKMTKVTV
jgi:chromosome partitioning protein